MKEKIIQTIQKQIEVIKASQNPDGSFTSFSGPHFKNLSSAAEYRTVFFAANILSHLNETVRFLGEDVVDPAAVRLAAAGFLLAEKNPHWSFNYWAHDTREHEAFFCPDDLDDTSMALAALHGYDPNFIGGTGLANAAKLLITAEIAPGGPYRTWLAGKDAPPEWRDVDVAVNANVAYFLARLGIQLPNITNFIEQRIDRLELCSPYYPSVVHVIYFISRFYSGERKAALARMLLRERHKDGLWNNPLETAMAISALINLGYAEKISEREIIWLSAPERWMPYPFCADPRRDGVPSYAGSQALTIAFCMEAFAKYLNFLEPGTASVSENDRSLQKIKGLARERTRSLPRQLRNPARFKIENVTNPEIVRLPYRMHEALGKPESISPKLLDELALANLYGWISYTIYDHILDKEGDLSLLPLANFFIRKLNIYYAMFDRKISDIHTYHENLLDTIDAASLWENRRCKTTINDGVLAIPEKLPYALSLQQLAEKSIAHALPALTIFFFMQRVGDSAGTRPLVAFFRNYLAARQLHDDAHDWERDLLQGHINAAGARLLKLWRARENRAAIELLSERQNLQVLFWREVVPDIIDDIKMLLNDARKELGKVPGIINSASLEELLGPLGTSAERTLRERTAAIEFLDAYQPPSQK